MFFSFSAPAALKNIKGPELPSPKRSSKEAHENPHYLISRRNRDLFDYKTIVYYELALQSSYAHTIPVIPVPKAGSLNLKDCSLLAQSQIDCFGYGIRNSVGLAFFNCSTKKWVTSIEAAQTKTIDCDQVSEDSEQDLAKEQSGVSSPTGTAELPSPAAKFSSKKWRGLPGRAKF
jgi:hypothetical protein